MGKQIVIAILTLAIAGCGAGSVFAHGADSLPSAGLTPSNFFYFLDRWGETIQEWFTFGAEAQAMLQLQFAGERISELQLELNTNGADAPGLEIARQRLAEHIEKGDMILKDEERKGNDVSEIASKFDDKLKGLLSEADEQESGDLSNELNKVEDELSNDFDKQFQDESAALVKPRPEQESEIAKPAEPER